jgi:large subunit ribosomal protein L18
MSESHSKKMEALRYRRERAHRRVRARVNGTPGRPRLSVYRSLRFIYAQIIDDQKGTTLVQANSGESDLGFAFEGSAGSQGAAKAVGQAIAERALAKGLEKVVFDRGGFIYHGKIKAVADGARESGLKF